MSESNPQKGRVRWEGFSAASGFGSGSRILTVDDNDAMRYSLVRSLQDAGYNVVEARTGQEALTLAAQAPDLITLDVNLPDMTGFQVCRQLKSDPATASIPVLHVSSTFVDPEYRVKGLEGGADAYLAEPIDRAELVATIGALLRLKNAENRARQQAAEAEAARQELARLNASLEYKIKERTTELQIANEGLRELSARLLKMRDEERRRLARELHDSVGQLLAAITMNLDMIGRESDKLSPPSVQALADNSSMVREVMQSIRTISHLLHPPLLDEAGLPSALQWYVDEFSKRSGIRVDLDCEDSTDRLPSEMETAIFRIVQECLGNVHRHSESQTASIRLEISGDRALVEVRDDGKGISPSMQEELKSKGHMGVGLRGIRERIAQFGGELQIDSGSSGTVVTAVIPCTPIPPAAADEVA
jgi:signal transduction histidine kinase